MTRTLPQAPHDNITYLSALARHLGIDLDYLCSAVEKQYTGAAFTQPGWFEAERAGKAALIQAALADATKAAGRVQVLVSGLDPRTLAVDVNVPLASALDNIAGALAAVIEQYEQGERPLSTAKVLLSALGRCEVACRRAGHAPLSATLTQLHVHLMLMVGQYELSPAPVAA